MTPTNHSFRLIFSTKRTNRAFVLLCLVGFSVLWGCYNLKVEDAFNGKFSQVEGNKVINDYCQSCHIHRDFDPGKHVLMMRPKYRRSLYRKASDCRVCHYVKPVWGREELARKTRYPKEVELGKYRKFEKIERKRTKR